MSYLEQIQEAYERVRKGNVSQSSIQKALQYENWQHLPEEITRKILDHPDYHLLTTSSEWPVPKESLLIQDCQIPGKSKRIKLAYSLRRFKPGASSPQFHMVGNDDFPELYKKLQRGEKYDKVWITINHLSLQSEHDLFNLVHRLGLYHWDKLPPGIPVFCLKWQDIHCVKPNALDAGLVFYFHQIPGQDSGSTRNLKTGKPDMEEWLYLNVNDGLSECVNGCVTSQKIKLDMTAYYKNNAYRMRRQKAV